MPSIATIINVLILLKSRYYTKLQYQTNIFLTINDININLIYLGGYKMLSNIVSNFSSQEAVYHHQNHSNDYNNTISRLASGEKTNDIGDDPSVRSSIGNISRDIYANKDLFSNINNSKALLSSASIYIDEQLNDMSDVKENLLKLGAHNLEESEKTQIKIETRRLLDKIDSTANIAQFNDYHILNGELAKATFQTGIKSFENIEVNIPSTQTNNLGKARFETGQRIVKAEEFDLIFKVNDTEEYSLGNVIIGSDKGTGIGKISELINNAKDKIGQQAFYDVTTTGKEAISKGTINDLKINDIAVGSVEVKDDDSDNALIDAINKVSTQSGVIASKDSRNILVLSSPDGRGIKVTAVSGLSIAGIDSDNAENYGKLTLVSTEGKRASLDEPKLLGFGQTDNFAFSARNIIEKSLPQDKIASLGAFPNAQTNLSTIFDSLDNKKLLKAFSFLATNAITDLNNAKSSIGFAINKLTESQDRIFDLNITYKNALDDKQNIDYADEIYNKEKFSNLLSSSTYALNSSLSKQKDIIEALFKSIQD